MEGQPAELIAKQLLDHQGMHGIPPNSIVESFRYLPQELGRRFLEDPHQAFSAFKERIEDKGLYHDRDLKSYVSKFKPYF